MSDYTFDEAGLVRRLIEHENDALSELYQQFGGLVYSIALRVVQNSALAEEVTQDAFLKVWNQPENWDPNRGRFISWLLSITRYTAIDRLRREQRRPLQHAVEFDDMRMGVSDDSAWEDAPLIRSLLDRLPEEQVQVIELAFYEGMSHSEMAEYLGLPLGTVKTRVRLGLMKLKSCIRESPLREALAYEY